jgi:lipoteichoic acid synthase
VKDLPYSDQVKGYLAANLDLEDALTLTLEMLEEKGIADDTVICIGTDHFPYGLDNDAKLGDMPYLSELYGYPVTTSFERDHNRLILWSGCLEEMEPIVVDSPTSSLDILPTLSNLFGTEYDSRLFVGRDVFSDAPALVFNDYYDWKSDYGTYYSAKGQFVAKEGVTVPEGHVQAMMTQVRNKIQYGSLVLETDYFRYLFEK